MNSLNDLKTNWIEIKTKLKQKYILLTEHDVKLEKNKEEEMINRILKKLGKTREELNRIIEGL